MFSLERPRTDVAEALLSERVHLLAIRKVVETGSVLSIVYSHFLGKLHECKR